ncbi:hypothetical protein F2Q69_00023156 [Brassica cretica]|uniref:Uncharacterized protein n=1 Tax=Brassica cretica TaxID=69181 RepID=A0A8S9Q2K9_BRACR|nr:hypothetical protein F2Q69_00023156 [Brassica cretica]
MSALRRATSIFGICTQYVRGERRSMGAGGSQSIAFTLCRLMAGTVSSSMLMRACRSVLIEVHRSMFEVRRRSTPMQSAEAH